MALRFFLMEPTGMVIAYRILQVYSEYRHYGVEDTAVDRAYILACPSEYL